MRTRTQSEDIAALSSSIAALQKEVASCKKKVTELGEQLEERPVVKSTFLLDVGAEFEVIQPIPVIIEESEDETIISFTETGLFGSGSTETEALMTLKNNIADLYDDLVNTPTEQLGKLPLVWLRILKKVIKPIGKPDAI